MKSLTLVLLSLLLLTGCRQWDNNVACHRDQDCPSDAGVPFCSQWIEDITSDSGLSAEETLNLTTGYCTADEKFKGNFQEDDSGQVTVDEPTDKDDEMNPPPMGGGPGGGGGGPGGN